MRRLAVLNFLVLGSLAALYFVPPKGVQLRAKYEKIRDASRLHGLLGLAELDDDAPAYFV
jgi:hypothetical protein